MLRRTYMEGVEWETQNISCQWKYTIYYIIQREHHSSLLAGDAFTDMRRSVPLKHHLFMHDSLCKCSHLNGLLWLFLPGPVWWLFVFIFIYWSWKTCVLNTKSGLYCWLTVFVMCHMTPQSGSGVFSVMHGTFKKPLMSSGCQIAQKRYRNQTNIRETSAVPGLKRTTERLTLTLWSWIDPFMMFFLLTVLKHIFML